MNAIYTLDKNIISPDTAFTRPSSVTESSINPYNNAKGGTKDLIPTGFKELSKEKTLAKLGSNIDKGVSFGDPAKVVVKKQEAKKEDKKEDKEKKEDKDKKETNNSSDPVTPTTPSSPPPILKPVAPGDNSD